MMFQQNYKTVTSDNFLDEETFETLKNIFNRIEVEIKVREEGCYTKPGKAGNKYDIKKSEIQNYKL